MDQLELADRFDLQRPRLRSVAYRIVGSLSEADDAVQEAWLRLQRADAHAIDNLEGWLATVVARISLNILRDRRAHPEEPLDGFRPEPIISTEAATDPEHEVLLAEAVGIALQVVLDSLSPGERLAFVLHDMFAVPFDEIAELIERSPEATRQLASRARRRVQGAAPAPDPDLTRQRALVDAYPGQAPQSGWVTHVFSSRIRGQAREHDQGVPRARCAGELIMLCVVANRGDQHVCHDQEVSGRSGDPAVPR
jgi:RNA polymerase sigma factor (sigma-70 family)